jgi:transcriptional regulator with XRE-family HTH domain
MDGMSENRQELPFRTLGEKLKTIRQKLHESVSEVSGAVEIDEQELLKIEQGSKRPSEDILLLLINHFGMQDDDAASLWQLAGYDQPDDHEPHAAPSENQSRTMVMIMAVDPRIIYSDGVQVTANSAGVVFNFAQGVGTPHALTTARIGMSRDQARSLLTTLQTVLDASAPKQLPPGPADKKRADKKEDRAK